MLLLDWEKAFDRVFHQKLLESLRRIRIPEKIVKVVESLYKNPEFIVEINGKKRKQEARKRYKTRMPAVPISVCHSYDNIDT